LENFVQGGEKGVASKFGENKTENGVQQGGTRVGTRSSGCNPRHRDFDGKPPRTEHLLRLLERGIVVDVNVVQEELLRDISGGIVEESTHLPRLDAREKRPRVTDPRGLRREDEPITSHELRVRGS
jgi:hypothetical protein